MTIDEAIKDLRYDAQCNRADLDIEWAERNEQLAEWLEKLKAIENGFTDDLLNMGFTKGYSKAINDYNEALHEEIGKYQFPVEKIDEIADRLKRWWDNAK